MLVIYIYGYNKCDFNNVELVKYRQTQSFRLIIQTEWYIQNCVSFALERWELLLNLSNKSK